MSKGLRRSCLVELFICLVLLSHGCASRNAQQDIESWRLNFWKPHLLYIQSAQCRSLHVEIDAVEGCGPSAETLDRLHQFLSSYCDKPEGIVIYENPSIPIGESHSGRPEILLLRQMRMRNKPVVEGTTAYLHILFYDSSQMVPPRKAAINPYVQMVPYPSALYIDVQYVKTHRLASHVTELLLHEVGHVLGLAWSKTDNCHCLHDGCLMNRTYTVARLSPYRHKEKDLCSRCKSQLLAAQSEDPDSRLSFHGPVLVRSEKCYRVFCLPGFVKLHSGTMSQIDCGNIIEEACVQVPELAPAFESVAVLMNQPSLDSFGVEGAEDLLSNARNDPCATVRLGVTAIDKQLRSLRKGRMP